MENFIEHIIHYVDLWQLDHSLTVPSLDVSFEERYDHEQNGRHDILNIRKVLSTVRAGIIRVWYGGPVNNQGAYGALTVTQGIWKTGRYSQS